jgi:hypothetical protein
MLLKYLALFLIGTIGIADAVSCNSNNIFIRRKYLKEMNNFGIVYMAYTQIDFDQSNATELSTIKEYVNSDQLMPITLIQPHPSEVQFSSRVEVHSKQARIVVTGFAYKCTLEVEDMANSKLHDYNLPVYVFMSIEKFPGIELLLFSACRMITDFKGKLVEKPVLLLLLHTEEKLDKATIVKLLDGNEYHEKRMKIDEFDDEKEMNICRQMNFYMKECFVAEKENSGTIFYILCGLFVAVVGIILVVNILKTVNLRRGRVGDAPNDIVMTATPQRSESNQRNVHILNLSHRTCFA